MTDHESPSVDPSIPRCALCHRSGLALTRHHLIPRSRHNKPRTRRTYSRQDMTQRIVMVCRPCHSTIHHHLTEQQCAEHYPTVEALQQHPDIAKFVAWVRHQPAGRRLSMRRPKSRR